MRRGLHTINPRLFPEQIVYIVNHAEDQYVFFDLTFAAAGREASRRTARACKGWVAMTDRAHMPQTKLRQAAVLRGPDQRPLGRLRLARVRREHRLVAVLHLGHDRQSQGRAVLAPLDRAARLRRLPARRAEPVGARRDAAGGADVPRQRLGPAVLPARWPAAKLVFPGAGLDGASLLRAVRDGAGHGVGRRAHGLARAAAAHAAEQPASSAPCAAPSSAARPARRR